MGIEVHPPVFGVPMYQILRNSKIILNKHIYAVKNFASNQRLFEVTGVGSMILTDAAINLEELFKPGEEIVAYSDINECVTLAKQYLNDEKTRESIAKTGCRRTLRDHTVSHRAPYIKAIIDQHCSSILP
jgi:spore maturation protein CgeB